MKQKIRVLDMGGNVTFVEGTPVVVPTYEKYSFLFCKQEHLKGYIVREVSTGLSVYPYWKYCKNKAQAIDTAQEFLDMYHDKEGRFEFITKKYLKEYNGGNPINEPLKEPKKTKIKQGSIIDE